MLEEIEMFFLIAKRILHLCNHLLLEWVTDLQKLELWLSIAKCKNCNLL